MDPDEVISVMEVLRQLSNGQHVVSFRSSLLNRIQALGRDRTRRDLAFDILARRNAVVLQQYLGHIQNIEPQTNFRAVVSVGLGACSRPMRRAALSWLAMGWGLLVGFLALARFGMAWPPINDDLPGWLLRGISHVDGVLLGPVFLAGSIVALRSRKQAGIIFSDLHAGYSFIVSH